MFRLSKVINRLRPTIAPTRGGGGTGSDVSEETLVSLAYHHSKNWRKNIVTDSPEDRLTAATPRHRWAVHSARADMLGREKHTITAVVMSEGNPTHFRNQNSFLNLILFMQLRYLYSY